MKHLKLGSVFAAGASLALVMACAGGTGDTSSPLRAPGTISPVLTSATQVGQAGDGVANQGEVEVCKYGTDASFSVVVGGGQPSVVAVANGACKVVALDFSTNQTATSVTVTEVADPSYSLVSVQRTVIQFETGTQNDILGVPTNVPDGQSVAVNAFHGALLVYHNDPVTPPPAAVCDFITFGKLVAYLNGKKVVVSGNIGGNKPGGGILSEFHVEANGVDNHVANVDTYGPIASGPLSGPSFPNSRMSTGTAKNGVAVEVRMWDGGEPGKGTDVLYVKLNGVEILGPNGQLLDQGNMQYHSNCRGPG